MSREIVKKIIERTKEDSAFFDALLANPDKALEKFDLDEAERDFFRNADRKTIEGLKSSCFELAEKRKCKCTCHETK